MVTLSTERRAVLVFAAVLAALTILPYLWVHGHPEGFVSGDVEYTWILPPYPSDSLSYAAWTRQAADGALLFQVKYTGIDHDAVIFQPVFLIAGWLQAATEWPTGAALLAVRTLGVLGFVWTFHWFCLGFSLSRRQRVLALLLVVVSSGFGGLLAPAGLRSADVWMPDLNTLWSLVWNPVLSFSLVLLLAVAGNLQRHQRDGRRRRLIAAGALTGLLAFVHPYDVVPAALLGLFAVGTASPRSRMLGSLVSFALPAAPPVLFQGSLALFHPVLSAHSGALMESPAPWSYLTGLGLPLVLAVAAVVMLGPRRIWRDYRLLVFWILATALLLYLPVWFQRRFVTGLHPSVCVLGAVGLDLLATRAAGGRRPVWGSIVAALLAASSITHVHNARMTLVGLRQNPSFYFLPRPIAEALDFLASDSHPSDKVLAHANVATHIPGRTGNTVTHGHWAQSVDAEDHDRWLRFLFATKADGLDPQRAASLSERGIDYVVVDAAVWQLWLRQRMPDWLTAHYDVVFRNDGAMILKAKD
jgi:hypothetical protein